ncbi:MAG: type II secretion system protein GspM [Hyphomonadaceae bacterium]
MIAHLASWWRARTARERMLLQGAALFVLALLLPLASYNAALRFRAAAAAELSSAAEVRANVARLAEAAGTEASSDFPGTDGTLRGLAMAAAEAEGMVVSRIDQAGPDRVRLSVAPVSSLAIYRWIDAVSRRGAFVSQTALVRSGEGDLVTAEMELATSP